MPNNKYKFNNSDLHNQLQNSFTFKDLPVFTEPVDGGILPEVTITTEAPKQINPITNTLYKLNIAQEKNNNSSLLNEFREGQNIGAGIAAIPLLATSVAELAPLAIQKGVEGVTWVTRHPIRFTTDLLAGYGIDKAANDIKINGKSTVEHISDKTNLPEWAVNLGIGTIGGIGFEKGIMNPAFSRARAAFYRNVTPGSYRDVGPMKKGKELINALGEFVDLRKIKLNTDELPKWYKPLKDYFSTHPRNYIGLHEYEIDVRDAAIRKALHLEPRPGWDIYVDNGDGTFSYDMNLLNQYRYTKKYDANGIFLSKEKKPFKPSNLMLIQKINKNGKVETIGTAYREFNESWVTGDFMAGNGGMVNARWTPDYKYIEIKDIWDVQPFKDKSRLPNLNLSKLNLSNLMNKYFPNFEVINTFGGTPFKLKQQFEVPYDQ